MDLIPQVGGRGRPPSDHAKGYVTIRDVVKQLSEAYAVPWDSDTRL